MILLSQKIKEVYMLIKKDMIIRQAQKDINKKLQEFKKEFDKLMNEYYDYLPLPQGKSIIENTTSSGKTFYLVVFNDTKRKNISIIEIYNNSFLSLPSHYLLLNRIDIKVLMSKVKENLEKSLYNETKKFLKTNIKGGV
ncbi:MAG: hypothetical protein ACPL4C_04805 [Brevinematia bacterium]